MCILIPLLTGANAHLSNRTYRTTGASGYTHPIQEAAKAQARLHQVAGDYDEFLVLQYRATNDPPFAFEWVNESETQQLYAAALVRITNEYQNRF